jgi:hypothetical protein
VAVDGGVAGDGGGVGVVVPQPANSIARTETSMVKIVAVRFMSSLSSELCKHRAENKLRYCVFGLLERGFGSSRPAKAEVTSRS